MSSVADVFLAAFEALDKAERAEVMSRLGEAHVRKLAGSEDDLSRIVRTLCRLAVEVGGVPTVTQAREVLPRLQDAGEDVETFSRLYKHFNHVWPQAVEALGLSDTSTPRLIEARFRNRGTGKVWRYNEPALRDFLAKAVEHYGYPPLVSEFEWYRARELELARARGERPHLPSDTPYRRRWGTWEAALLHFGYTPDQVAERRERA